jgi:uridine kinase
VVDQPVTPVLILEGVGALRKEFRQYLTLGVFISVPRDVCLQRDIERDASFGLHDEIQRLWEEYYSDEERYLARDEPEGYADVILDGTRSFEGQLDLRSSS